MRQSVLWFLIVLLMAGCTFSPVRLLIPESQSTAQQAVLLVADVPDIMADDLEATQAVIGQRLAALDVEAETIIRGSQCIEIHLPEAVDVQAILPAITQTGLLEFVDFSGLSGIETAELEGQRIRTTESIPAVTDALVHPHTGEAFQTVITGAMMESTGALYTDFGQWTIEFTLSEAGGEIFGAYTAAHIGQPLAIVVDGVVRSAPIIQGRLDTGGVISGNFTEEEARQLALQLMSGALAVPLRLEATTIAPADQPAFDVDTLGVCL